MSPGKHHEKGTGRNTLQARIQSAVIISNEIHRFIEPRILPEVPVFWEDDPLEKLGELQGQASGHTLSVLVFLPSTGISNFCDSLGEFRSLRCRAVVFALHDDPPGSLVDCGAIVEDYRNSPVSASEFEFLVRKHCSRLPVHDDMTTAGLDEDVSSLLDAISDQEALISIGRSLSLEKDPEKLLRSMLYLSKKITGADAGSIFLVEEQDGQKMLRFTYTHTFSRDLQYEEWCMPLDTRSIAGYVAVTGRVLNIPDVYQLKRDDPVSFNESFDLKSGYRSRSMLVVPMRNHLDEIIGVIQLINCKERPGIPLSGDEAFRIVLDTEEAFERNVVPFHTRYEALMEAVASQAAIALENRRMIKRIQEQFEEFVKASVSAIESRDPVTAGHSLRVASLSVALAAAVNGERSGAFSDAVLMEHEIKEIEFAALLHDFGKVYINPEIFLKAKKLFPKDLANMTLRLDFLKRTVELVSAEEEKLLCLESRKAEAGEVRCRAAAKLRRLDEIKKLLADLNEPSVGDINVESSLVKLETEEGLREYTDYEGNRIPLLSGLERKNLSISRGSLNAEERKEIENHVTYSYAFVRKIPWPPEYARIPEIVLKHHERLDGSGYPGGVSGRESIPLGSRIIALADVYDALSSPDRPYKKAIPHARIIEILRLEASEGKLDPDLVELFLREQLFLRSQAGSGVPVQSTTA